MTRATSNRLRVGIVGGGIGGVALAIGLSRHVDLDVTLFESAQAFSEIGAGVSFGPNAVRAIERLELGEAYRRVADGSPAPFEDVWFEWRHGIDDNYITATLAPGCGQSSVHRADFLDSLVTCLPDGIAHFGKRCCDVAQNEDGVHLSFTDGTHAECDVAIGCDGIKSVLRDHVLPAEHHGDTGPRFSGTYAYRGLVSRTTLESELERRQADVRLARVPQMLLGEDRHILTFPVKDGEVVNVVAFETDSTRSRPRAAVTGDWVETVSRERMLAAFADWGEGTQAILGCIEQPTRWALHDIAPLPHYHRERVLLIGDAAHAMLPHQGAGAGQALEDAWVLSELLGDSACDRTRVNAVLAEFDRARRPHSSEVQRTSFEAGELYERRGLWRDCDDAELARELETRFDWLWSADPQHTINDIRTLLATGHTASPTLEHDHD
ncbi:salicylate 1-monooxygenase [Larsenimonas suaedae]|uniref:Salicylate 1-monooxygenase n=1 Tax=Larsenimonas suaedae TaxID=1851019 RepID=A0ABU1GRY2_9GAMM|nr:salicylate 1-monooxygenase [Larsenimonas suaedae]MCM2972417.1 salicylate 1-monooxygenase [Larsenimonas suaedae]MDR5894787.1 salicylate 1-monooxygenase [Larsenimonas suaedae]